jgi:hypothetical protein
MEIIITITIVTVTIWLVIEKHRLVDRNDKPSNLESLRNEAVYRNPALSSVDQMNALYRTRIKEIITLRKFDQDTHILEVDLWCIINEVNRLIAQEVEEMSDMEVRRFDEVNECTTEITVKSPLILETNSSIHMIGIK